MKKFVVFFFMALIFCMLFFCNKVLAQSNLSPYEWHSKHSEYNADFQKIVGLVTDYKQYEKILPYVDKTLVISSRGQEAICYFEHYEQSLMQTFWMQVRFKVLENTSDTFIVKTKYMKGNAHPFESEIIVKKISEMKTSVITRVKVEYPGPDFVPDSVINYYLESFLSKALEKLHVTLKQ